MASYRYVAYEPTGRRVARAMAAQSPDEVKHRLWSEGLHIVEIHERWLQIPPMHELFPTFMRVRRSEVILFTKELGTFVRVGLPILEGLAVLKEQASSQMMRHALDDMISDLSSGSSLSEALAQHPKIFSPLYVDMIRSSEVSGNLDDVLRQLANYMTRDETAIRKVRNALVYPAIVISLALVVIGVLVGFVLPAFARLFHDFRSTMPLPTRILLTIGNFCKDHWLAILACLAAIVLFAWLYSKTKRGHGHLDAILLKLPALGLILKYAIIERYLRTLSTLARAGVPITQMIDTANNSLGNSVFEKKLATVRAPMLSGDGFAGPLASTGLFPRLAIQMIKVGEETGNLDSNLDEAAEHYAEEVDYRLKHLVTILEPAMVLVVGAMVGFIAISVIAPMYGLVHAIR